MNRNQYHLLVLLRYNLCNQMHLTCVNSNESLESCLESCKSRANVRVSQNQAPGCTVHSKTSPEFAQPKAVHFQYDVDSSILYAGRLVLKLHEPIKDCLNTANRYTHLRAENGRLTHTWIKTHQTISSRP